MFQRGTYGIEYDEQQGSPFRRWLVPAALVLAVALPLLFFRSCGGQDKADDVTDEKPGQTRYRVPEVEAQRERPSFWRHFLKRGTPSDAADTATAGANVGTGASAPSVAQGQGVVAAGGSGKVEPRPAAPVVVAPPTAKVQSVEVKRLLERIAEYENADDLVNARQILHQLLLRKDAEDVRAFVERKIGAINTVLVFGDRPMPEKTRHRLGNGDLISKLSKRYGNTQAYLLKANGIDQPNRLRVGREIWVLEDPVFELTIFAKASNAVLTLNGQFFKRYETGLGKPDDTSAGLDPVRKKLSKHRFLAGDLDELCTLLPTSRVVIEAE